jgi:hypothetical protein
MITDDEVLRLFERADPAQDDDRSPVVDANAYLDALRARSIDVTLTRTPEPTTTDEPRRARHRWPIIAAAAVLLIVVVGVITQVGRDDRDDPTPVASGVPAPEDVTTAFMQAYGDLDADRAMGYLSNEVVTEEFGSPELFRARLQVLEANRWQQTTQGCTRTAETSTGVTVECAYEYHGLGSEELGRGPYGENEWIFIVRDGRIVASHNDVAYDTNGYDVEMWEPFQQWVSTTHPEDFDAMYASGGSDLVLDDTSARLWKQHLDEYLATRSS